MTSSQGALIVQGFKPVGSFGSFCSVIVGLGLIANCIGPTYSSGIDAQILGRWAAIVPRVVWNTVGVIIYTVMRIGRSRALGPNLHQFPSFDGVLGEHLGRYYSGRTIHLPPQNGVQLGGVGREKEATIGNCSIHCLCHRCGSVRFYAWHRCGTLGRLPNL